MIESDPTADEAKRLEAFLDERRRLVRLAYRYLGSLADAEDVVQEAWLRFSGVADVQDPARLLSTIVTRLCLDRMKSAQARRESYVGQWLPEPVVGADYSADDERALDISFAVMRTLERLSAAERAAFFLHDLWGLSFDEIGVTLSRSPAACRKLASRARSSLAEARQRFQPSRDEVQRLVSVFEAAIEQGDPAGLKALLAEDVELVADGGGKVLAARNILHGAAKVSRFLVGVGTKRASRGHAEMRHTIVNDAPALLVLLEGTLDQTLAFDLDAERRIRTIYIVRNPDKLLRIAPPEDGHSRAQTE